MRFVKERPNPLDRDPATGLPLPSAQLFRAPLTDIQGCRLGFLIGLFARVSMTLREHRTISSEDIEALYPEVARLDPVYLFHVDNLGVQPFDEIAEIFAKEAAAGTLIAPFPRVELSIGDLNRMDQAEIVRLLEKEALQPVRITDFDEHLFSRAFDNIGFSIGDGDWNVPSFEDRSDLSRYAAVAFNFSSGISFADLWNHYGSVPVHQLSDWLQPGVMYGLEFDPAEFHAGAGPDAGNAPSSAEVANPAR